ncbi:hypothetical protein Tco_1103801 [Tanacetum coccineum]
MYYPRFTKVIIHHFLTQEKTLSWSNKIGMHTSKDDYLINSLRFVSAKESTQIYGAILPECLTSPVMKESKAYKTYLGYATCAIPPKIARKFKKTSPSKKDSDLVLVDEEPVQKGKRVKRPAKKSTNKPAAGVVIREAPVETKSKSKEKEMVEVTRRKGIELLSEVALTEEAQMKEVRKKSLRDFHKTHPSGSGTVAIKPPSVDKITPIDTSEGTGDKPVVPDVTEDDSTESEYESWGNDEDGSNNDDQDSRNEDKEEEFVHTPSPTYDKDDENLESESDEVIKSDEEKGLDDTTYQFDDDVDARLKESTQTDKEVIQGEGADAEMHDAQQGNENLETTQEQVVEDAHVTISTVTKKTKVHATSSSRSSDLASKFLKFLDIPHTDAEIVYPLDIHATPTPPLTIETINPLSTLPDFASVFRFNNRIATLEKEVAELKKDPLHTQSLTARIKEQVKDQLPQILPKEVSNFALPVIEKLIKESRDEVTLAKRGRKDKDKDEDPSAGSDRGLKKRKTSKDAEPTTGLKNKDSTSGSSKDTKSQPKPSGKSVYLEEPCYEMELIGQETSSKSDWFQELPPPQRTTDPGLHDFDELMSTPIDFSGYILNGLKIRGYLQGGVSTMTYTTSSTKTKTAQYDLSGIEDMVPNIWSPVKVAYDRYALWGISHWREQHSSKGDFPRLWINDIEDMLILVVQNRLINLSGDDVADFAIALRMFTRSLVIQKRVEDLQLGVESYQKKINITKPDTTRLDLRKRHPYTPYKDPQGFIYVDDYKRNRLMRSDELHKFSDGTLTRLLSSLEDITKNIDMKYLPKRRWSTLEKKRVHFMIKDINKLLKERRKMMSLEKFIGGRLYGTDLRLLQRTI